MTLPKFKLRYTPWNLNRYNPPSLNLNPPSRAAALATTDNNSFACKEPCSILPKTKPFRPISGQLVLVLGLISRNANESSTASPFLDSCAPICHRSAIAKRPLSFRCLTSPKTVEGISFPKGPSPPPPPVGAQQGRGCRVKVPPSYSQVIPLETPSHSRLDTGYADRCKFGSLRQVTTILGRGKWVLTGNNCLLWEWRS